VIYGICIERANSADFCCWSRRLENPCHSTQKQSWQADGAQHFGAETGGRLKLQR
jgi:hypothetical protein